MPSQAPAPDSDFERIKRYLLECPFATPETSPALEAALEGLTKEEARIQRDMRLQRNFAAAVGDCEDAVVVGGAERDSDDIDGSPSKRKAESAEGDHDRSDDMEWQDVAHAGSSGSLAASRDPEDSALGRQLAKGAVDALALDGVGVSSPVSAVAAALHASLLSMGFSCTGVPDEAFGGGGGGFAAPVRDISAFLPKKWESRAGSADGNNQIALRYRKDGAGSMVLLVQDSLLLLGSDSSGVIVTVCFLPASAVKSSSVWDEVAAPASTDDSMGDARGSLSFPLSDHFNMDSWNAACQKHGKKGGPLSMAPALHYMRLSSLLTSFCRTFDLGGPVEGFGKSGVSTQLPYRDSTIVAPPTASQTITIRKSDFVDSRNPPFVPASASNRTPNRPWESTVPSTIGEAFPKTVPGYPGGDFGSDIAPGGLSDPRFGIGGMPGGVRMPGGGNLMGPNHPAFVGGIGPGAFVGGPGSMQPRFDPFGPPGGPQEPPRRGGRWSGEPDPDNLRPDMFS